MTSRGPSPAARDVQRVMLGLAAVLLAAGAVREVLQWCAAAGGCG